MNEALDIANQIVRLSNETGEPVTNIKLQKLIYYTYAWYAVEKGKPLFEENIEAWKYGPVIPSVYEAFSEYGADIIKKPASEKPPDLDRYTEILVEDIFKAYGGKSAIELVELTHSEAPWRDRYDPEEENIVIPFEEIKKYYTSKKEFFEKQNVKEKETIT